MTDGTTRQFDGDDPLLLHALADGELDAATALALERRIAADPALAADYARIGALKAAVGRLERPEVTAAFAARIGALAAARPVAGPARVVRHGAWTADWRVMAASLVLTAFAASGVTWALVAPPSPASIEEQDIVGGHRRSLLAASPIDIASSDRHTVRPWLDGKLGLSPPTPDLAKAGFTLVGGRVDVIADKPVPSLVYRHKEHLITVVAVPVAPGRDVASAPTPSTAGGYNIVRWSAPGFRYWAVSDLDAAELAGFAEAMRAP